VRGDHDRVRRGAGRIVRAGSAAGAQAGEHDVVVDEIAEDGQRRRVDLADRQLDGITNPETYAQLRRAQDSHSDLAVQRHFSLCIVKSTCQDVFRGGPAQ
jgi:hypothetical protein